LPFETTSALIKCKSECQSCGKPHCSLRNLFIASYCSAVEILVPTSTSVHVKPV